MTLPTNYIYPTRQSDDVYYQNPTKLDEFKDWKDAGKPGNDPDVASTYPTLFDYYESELYSHPVIITGLDADYILINLAAERLSPENPITMYTMNANGGDETKAFWFMKIADLYILHYYNTDIVSYTDKFWNETLLGKLIPFSPLVYVDPGNTDNQSHTFKPGYTAIYVRDIKFPSNGDGPFQLVYASPSFENQSEGPVTGALIYKINKEYNPNQ